MTDLPTGSAITRRDVLRGGASGALALTGAAWLAGCGGGAAGSHAAGSGSIAHPVRGGTLTVAMITGGSAEVIDVARAFSSPDIARVENIWDGLYRSGPGGYGVPQLATAESSPDAKLWTFRLRHGVTWHDGKPLTADDLLYTIRSWNASVSGFNTVAGPVVDFSGVRKRDPLTVEVPLARGVSDFPRLTAICNAYVIQDGSKHGEKPVGTGPFRYESFTPGERSVFSANREYWIADQPYVDQLVIDSSFTDENTRVNALLAGDADVVPTLPFTLAKTYASNNAIRVESGASGAFYAPAFRVDQGPTRDPRVGLALKLLVDRDALVREAYDGYATPGNDLPGKGLPFFASDLTRERDIEQAQSLLEAAGYQNLTLDLKTSPASAGMVELATLFAYQAQAAGVNVPVKVIDPAVYFTAAGGYLTNQFAVEWWYTLPSLSYFYLTALNRHASLPETHWGDPRSDALLYDAVAETDLTRATEKWRAVQELQFERGGYIIPANYSSVDAYGTTVHGITATAGGPADNWNLKKAWKANG